MTKYVNSVIRMKTRPVPRTTREMIAGIKDICSRMNRHITETSKMMMIIYF